MATYTVRVKGVCAGGGHITLTVKRDGEAVKDFVVHRSDIMDRELSWEDVLPFFLHETVKRSGATTIAQAKAAIEAAEWVM